MAKTAVAATPLSMPVAILLICLGIVSAAEPWSLRIDAGGSLHLRRWPTDGIFAPILQRPAARALQLRHQGTDWLARRGAAWPSTLTADRSTQPRGWAMALRLAAALGGVHIADNGGAGWATRGRVGQVPWLTALDPATLASLPADPLAVGAIGVDGGLLRSWWAHRFWPLLGTDQRRQLPAADELEGLDGTLALALGLADGYPTLHGHLPRCPWIDRVIIDLLLRDRPHDALVDQWSLRWPFGALKLHRSARAWSISSGRIAQALAWDDDADVVMRCRWRPTQLKELGTELLTLVDLPANRRQRLGSALGLLADSDVGSWDIQRQADGSGQWLADGFPALPLIASLLHGWAGHNWAGFGSDADLARWTLAGRLAPALSQPDTTDPAVRLLRQHAVDLGTDGPTVWQADGYNYRMHTGDGRWLIYAWPRLTDQPTFALLGPEPVSIHRHDDHRRPAPRTVFNGTDWGPPRWPRCD